MRERIHERGPDYYLDTWHRTDHLSKTFPNIFPNCGDSCELNWRYGLHHNLADHLGLIDIDGCEYCPNCSWPLALIETTRFQDEPGKKHWRVTRNLAELAGIPAYLVEYQYNDWSNPTAVTGFRVTTYGQKGVNKTPEEFARWLIELHSYCTVCAEARK